MGLFSSNYEKAGSGVAKDAPKKKAFFDFETEDFVTICSVCSFFIKAPTETGKDPEEEIPEETETPDDILEKTLEQINQSLADDLLTEVLKLSPTAFEQFVRLDESYGLWNF